MPTIPLRRAKLHGLIAAQTAAVRPATTAHSIASIEAWNLRQPVSGAAWSLLRIVTRDGIEGWGEGHVLTREELASLRVLADGASAGAYEALRVKTHGHPGCGALNIAVLDVLAKAAKAPLYQLLGGPTRNKVRASTTIDGSTDEEVLQSLQRTRAAGHRAFSVQVPQPPFRNSGKALVLATSKRLDALRQAGGEDCDFILHGGGHLTVGDAAQLAAAFERFHLLWFDEPANTGSLGALRKISQENVTPLGFGAGARDASFFQNLLREDAIDIVRPELATHGVSGIRKIAALAEVYYVAVAPRHEQGPVTTAAALHLAASLPNFFMQHIPSPAAAADREMRATLTGTPLESVRDGYAALPTSPGLGIQIQRAALQKYGSPVA